jgi:5'-deoxynucleotidase YfbR-like HD superfamily hydrolase
LREIHKQDLFLLRGISVSLIYCCNTQVLYEYLKSLINMDLANSINRGFHLEYYGDKRYLPNQNMLDYEDNPRVGERTLRILCNSIDLSLKQKNNRPAMLLELFTVASLLQVRMETDYKQISFKIEPYMKRCCELIERVLHQQDVSDNVILSFFKMAKADFENYLKNTRSLYSPQRTMCNEYLAAKDVKRTGWVHQGIEDPESIMEHMYACWFIGLVFLPTTSEEISGYDKQKILNMLIVHDLAETKLTDIPKYEKVNYPNYDREENDAMLSVLLKGTYSSMSTLDEYVDAWNTWYERGDENARIAKDIDTIQAIYQFLLYYIKDREKFSEARAINWLKEVYEVRTELGQKILHDLIFQNELFADVMAEFSGKY